MVVLFDFDGVLMDTETHYTKFWNEIGRDYLGREDFGNTVKGQSMNLIYGKYFIEEYEHLRPKMTKIIDDMERKMVYNFIFGANHFLAELKDHGIHTAIVTSSDDRKMELVFKQHPNLPKMVDYIITSDQFSKSKPDPECYRLAMSKLGVTPNEAVVFEDSIYGIQAGKAAKAHVVGVATTNSRGDIKGLTDFVIDDFTQISVARLDKLYANW